MLVEMENKNDIEENDKEKKKDFSKMTHNEKLEKLKSVNDSASDKGWTVRIARNIEANHSYNHGLPLFLPADSHP